MSCCFVLIFWGFFDNYEFESQILTDCSTKDSLKSNVQLWGKNAAYDSVLDIIKHGYKIPFYSMPCRNFQKIPL